MALQQAAEQLVAQEGTTQEDGPGEQTGGQWTDEEWDAWNEGMVAGWLAQSQWRDGAQRSTPATWESPGESHRDRRQHGKHEQTYADVNVQNSQNSEHVQRRKTIPDCPDN